MTTTQARRCSIGCIIGATLCLALVGCEKDKAVAMAKAQAEPPRERWSVVSNETGFAVASWHKSDAKPYIVRLVKTPAEGEEIIRGIKAVDEMISRQVSESKRRSEMTWWEVK